MKTFKLFIIATLVFTATSNAQITKGNWMVGGSGSFSSKKYQANDSNGNKEINNYKSIDLTPTIGYFIIDKLSVGISLGYKGEFYIGTTTSPQQNYNSLYTGPFIRYYFLKPEKTFNIFAEGGYIIGNRHASSWAFESNDTKINSYTFTGGTSFFFNSSVGLELNLKYLSKNETLENSELKVDDFQVNIGFQIFLEKNK
jgi:hypothetical protein